MTMSSLPKEMPALNASGSPGHDLVAEDDALLLAAIAVDGVDHLLHLLLAQQPVDQIERRLGVERQKRAQPDPARCGFEPR
jgi:hypothetical protein